MFNVCPSCGQYNEAKEVLSAPDRAVCPSCQNDFEFKSLPLFVVTGASGSGKTTVALSLMKTASDYIVLDQDILWCDAFNTPDDDFMQFRNTWLRVIKNIQQAGCSVVLFGTSIPKQFETCAERRYLSEIHYLALVCEPEELKRRLLARPDWRQSGTPENLESMVSFNKWLLDNAAETAPQMTLLDTTDATLDQTVKATHDWVASKLT
ncbi:MAG: AAA family ATPase [Candidatus Melainabacteria bacterium]|nr:AAA family ATPase [Candidatus Melainabacteria bacterium]